MIAPIGPGLYARTKPRKPSLLDQYLARVAAKQAAADTAPTCPELRAIFDAVHSVGELCCRAKRHREICAACGPVVRAGTDVAAAAKEGGKRNVA